MTTALNLLQKLPLIAGGKSFGGRMTSQAQAKAPLQGICGLAFLGFPLHPAGRPSQDRAAHLLDVQIPMLFLQGTRDSLAPLDQIELLCKKIGRLATLKLFVDADHSFHVPARSGRKDAQVLGDVTLITAKKKSSGAAGKPDCPRDLNGFKQWSRIVRGALMWLGEADPVETMWAVREADPRLQASTSMLFAMREAFGDGARTAAEMVSLVDDKEGFFDIKQFLGSPLEARPKQKALRDAMTGVCKDGKISTQNLSYWLRKRNGQIISGLRLSGEADRTRLMHWRVVEGHE